MTSAVEQRTISIEIVEPCPECDGTGIIYDPYCFGWAELCSLPDDQYRQAMRDRGYDQYDRDSAGRLPPPEEGACDECEGARERRRRISLAELAELIGAGR
jgi:hypothetical protein